VPTFSPLILRGFPCRVRRIESIVYSSPGGGPLLADLYLPEEEQRPLPVIIWLHGGGWRFGDRRLGPDLARFFTERGFAMLSIDYRLSGTARFPAAIEDVKTAVRWVRAQGGEHGLDPSRIGLWGASAGGHLAALAALSGPGTFEGPESEYACLSSEVKAVSIGYPVVDFLQLDAHRAEMPELDVDPSSFTLPPAADPDSFESRFLGAPILTVSELCRQANPVHYVREGAPPFLIVHGTADGAVPHMQSKLLFDALAEAGNHATLQLIEGLGHGFLNRNDWDQGPARAAKVYESRPGEPVRQTQGPPVTFGTIELFFKRCL
jgi:acetyl esterase/lipase